MHIDFTIPRILLVLAFVIFRNSTLASQDDSIVRTSRLGPVSATIKLQPANPVIGDTLMLELDVVADEKVEVLMPEFGEALGRFQIIDFLPKEQRQPDSKTFFQQKYRLQSPSSGDHAVPPILIEFIDRRPGEKSAPDGMDAYELFTERINFTVGSVLVDDAAAELNPPLGKLDPPKSVPSPLVSNWAYVGVVAAGLVGVGLTFLAAAFYRRRVVKKSAYEIARRQLDQLLGQVSPQHRGDRESINRFYVELTSIIRRYLENRFELRAPELTTEEFLTTVSDSAELSGDHKKLLDHFLKHADLVKFAGVEPSESDIENSVASANKFLEETRENSPLLVEPESEFASSANGGQHV